MSIRSIVIVTACAATCHAAPAALAQSIAYETGDYEYAQPLPELDDDVVTETISPVEAETAGAARVIPARRGGAVPPVANASTIRSIDPSAPQYRTIPSAIRQPMPETEGQASLASPPVVYVLAHPQTALAGPQAYAVPVSNGFRTIQGTNLRTPAPFYMLPGSQVVAFDRDLWLEECRARLDTYENDAERAKAIGALAGAAFGSASDPAGGSDAQCRAYFEGYLTRARANAGTAPLAGPGDYMLVPVTIAVPQRGVYSDGPPRE